MLKSKFYIKNYTFYSEVYIAKTKSLNKLCYNNSKSQKKVWYVGRNIKLLPLLIDVVLVVHNGFKFIPIKVRHEMLGRKLGQFVFTRVRTHHHAIKARKKLS